MEVAFAAGARTARLVVMVAEDAEPCSTSICECVGFALLSYACHSTRTGRGWAKDSYKADVVANKEQRCEGHCRKKEREIELIKL